MAVPHLSWITWRHVLTSDEVSNTYGTFFTFGRHGIGISEGYAVAKKHYLYEPWRIYSLTAWVVDSNGYVKPGYEISAGEIADGLSDQYSELAVAVQGQQQKCRLISDVGYPVSHGVWVFLWNTFTAGDVLFVRIKYEVVK